MLSASFLRTLAQKITLILHHICRNFFRREFFASVFCFLLFLRQFTFQQLTELAMGLRERRAIHEIKTVVQPQYQAKLDELLGWHLPMDLDWDSFPELDSPIEGFMRNDYAYSFELVLSVMKPITADDIGKTAVKEKIQSIVFVNYNKTGSDTGGRHVELTNGRLEIHCGWGSYSSEIYDNYNNEFQKLVEDLL